MGIESVSSSYMQVFTMKKAIATNTISQKVQEDKTIFMA